jgi:hypothetical protein
MTDPGDIWQRYDTKVVQIQVMEARLVAIERELGQVRDERDHWARICRDLGKKLSVARTLAERLRNAERLKGGRQESVRTRRPGDLQAAINNVTGNTAIRGRDEGERAREVLGLVITALTKALDADDDAVIDLGRRLRHHGAGKLLRSMTRGSLTVVPVDGRYMVDRQWLAQLDLEGLRRELDVGAPGESQAGAQPAIEVDVDVEPDEYDASESMLPPPPPLASASFATLPPLISALPEESSDGLPRQDTMRATNPLGGVRIPNLSISRLVKTPRTT